MLTAVTSTSAKYTAPATAGVYLVSATSVADVTRGAVATVGVTDLAGVYTYRNDNLRSSINSKEYILNPTNVNASSFGKIFACTVDQNIYAQPLWVANVAIGGGTHNIVIVATQNDSVYAFDADNGNGTACTQYWKASLLLPAYGAASGATAVPSADTGETGDIPTQIGITATPVIDPSTNTLYVLSKTKESGSYFQRLHKLNLSTGAEMSGAPVSLAASVTGSGAGSTGNSLAYSALHQNPRPGLALVNGSIYISSGSHGDNEPWHGWILQYNAASLALTGAYCSTPNTSGGGIWMSGSAPVADSNNNLYVITSNGTYDGNTEFGDSFLRLSTTSGMTLSDWFTPSDQSQLASSNGDLGAGGAVTLLDSVAGPYPHLLIGGGKEGVLYLVNRDNMGHFNSASNSAAVQTWQAAPYLGNYGGISSSGEFWQNTFYIAGADEPLEAFAFNTTTGMFNVIPTSQSSISFAFPGLTPAVSAQGTASGIVWAIDSSGNGTNGQSTGPAVLYAFDASNLANELWDSTQKTPQGASNQAANAVKFAVPTVANGKVFVAAVTTLDVYGLLSQGPAATAPSMSPAPGIFTAPQSVTLTDATSGATIYYTLDGSTPTTSSPVYSSAINVSTTTTISAMATAPGLNNSTVSTGTYTFAGSGTPVNFVQGNFATPQSATSSVNVIFTGAQTAGNLNVVVVGWNDASHTVSSVTDSKGNQYSLAVGPTPNAAGGLTQAIYYAKNIAASTAGGNTVTVTFSAAAAFPDVRILEYAGADPTAPVDVAAAAIGNSGSSSVTAASPTTNANDLLFAANMVLTTTTGPGAGFVTRMITSPDSDIAEDRAVTVTATYSATANTSGGQWVMQLVALKAASSDLTPPSAPNNLTGTPTAPNQINLSWTASTDNVGVTGYLIERCQAAGCTSFAQIGTSTAASYSDTTLLGSTSYSYRVRATDAAGNLSAYSNVVSATTPADTTPPTTPTNLSPTPVSTTEIDLSWTASTDNVGVTNYIVQRCQGVGCSNFAQVSAPRVNSVDDTGLAPSTTYSYRVQATDFAGNLSGFSSVATATTFAVVPTVISVSPSSGSTVGATSVTVTGTNFVVGATVTFGATAATNVVVVNSTTITATTPAHAAGATTVTVTVSGRSGSLTNGFTYVATPTVTNVSPSSGSTSGGTGVTITGTNFVSGATVTFGSAAATNVVVVNSTTITATTPAGTAGAVTVTVTVSGQSGSLPSGFTYSTSAPPPPTVTNVSPNNGPSSGGTSVTITGTNFVAGATVTFGSAAATNVAVVNGTTITATSPAGSAGAVTVTVTVSGQSGSLATAFTYNAAPIAFVQGTSTTPQTSQTTVNVTFTSAQAAGDLNVVVVGWNDATHVINSVTDTKGNSYSLAIGPTLNSSGGLSQSIYYAKNIAAATAGSNVVTVTFSGATPFPDVRILEYSGVNTLDITAGASGSGTTSNSGTATTRAANELIVGANMVTSVTTAAGTGFTARMITSPDADIAEDKIVTAVGSNSATATLSSGAWVMQMATFMSGSLGPTPTVTSISPSSGPTAGGTSATITGTNFASGATVTFGAAAATNVVVISSTQITATTPAGSAGAATVTVTVGGQSGSLASGFAYIAPPTVTSVSPSSGPTAGGTSVTITGAGFASGATVKFGSTAATSVIVVSGTQITATTPAGAAGVVTVTVTANGQTGSLSSGFAYLAPPTVTSVSPNTGSTAGGTSVTITGTNFASGATVTFGSTAATNVVVVSGTTITATSPSGSTGVVAVTVTVSGQTGSLSNAFTYAVTPAVTSVTPNNGTTSGGTGVTITGANFASGATVTFGATAATNVVVVNSTTITATTPAHAAGATTVTVTVSGQSGSLTNGFAYIATPTVTNVSPSSGSTSGGTGVTITGTNFVSGATVTFGSAAATNVVVVNSTTITATTPAGAVGAVTVTVTVSGQSGSLSAAFTYSAAPPPPTVTSVSPTSGTASGGTNVTIAGANYAAGATVTFGAAAATNVTVVNGSTITATTPAGTAGAVTVTVTSNGQSGSLVNGFTYTSSVPISFVQATAATPQGSTAAVPVTFPSAETLGDFNIVVVGWNDTAATVKSVTDSAGNAYSLAIGPTSGTALRQSIYYANNVAAGGNTVTVTFNQSAAYPDVRILEYRGLVALDVTAGASGSSAAPNSGSATTTTPNELIFGADMIFTTTAGAGSGFTSRLITAPDSDLAEDKIVSAVGANSATATTNGSGPWVMQMATFKAGVNGPSPSAPSNLSGPAPVVQMVQSYINSTALLTHTTAAFDSTGGDVIVVFASSHAGVTMTPSDSFNNTWTSIAGPTNTSTGFDLRSQIWYAKNPTVGPGQTFTLNLSAAQSLVISVFVLKGSNVSNPIDVTSTIGDDAGTQSLNVASPNVVTTNPDDALIGFVKSSVSNTWTGESGFTFEPAASSTFLAAENGTSVAPGTYDSTFVLGTVATWQAATVAVEPAAASVTGTQLDLSWGPSFDNNGVTGYFIERCQGTGCVNFTQIGSTAATTFTDTGLTTSTTYNYRVRAIDSISNLGPYSNTVTISTRNQ